MFVLRIGDENLLSVLELIFCSILYQWFIMQNNGFDVGI